MQHYEAEMDIFKFSRQYVHQRPAPRCYNYKDDTKCILFLTKFNIFRLVLVFVFANCQKDHTHKTTDHTKHVNILNFGPIYQITQYCGPKWRSTNYDGHHRDGNQKHPNNLGCKSYERGKRSNKNLKSIFLRQIFQRSFSRNSHNKNRDHEIDKCAHEAEVDHIDSRFHADLGHRLVNNDQNRI